MIVYPLVDAQELSLAFDRLVAAVYDRAEPIPSQLGWQGGGGDYEVYWRRDLGIWARLALQAADKRYDCAYGIGDPRHHSNGIVCKTSIPASGINRRLSGLFVRDDAGEVFIAHNGRLSVRGRGSAERFISQYRNGERVTVHDPDGSTRDALRIGRLGDPSLPRQIAEWVRAVQRFKQGMP